MSDFLRARRRGVPLLRIVLVPYKGSIGFRSGRVEKSGFGMVSNNAKILVELPSFDQEKIHIFIKELKMWSCVTMVEKKKQGFLVWKSLPMNEVKKAVNERIGMDDLCKEDGMEKVLRLLRMVWREKE